MYWIRCTHCGTMDRYETQNEHRKALKLHMNKHYASNAPLPLSWGQDPLDTGREG